MHILSRLILLLPLLLVACGPPEPEESTTPTPTATTNTAPPAVTTPTATRVALPPTSTVPQATFTAVLATAQPTLQPDTAVYLRPAAGAASSFDTTPGFAPSPDPMNAADGDLGTRWAPQNGLDGQWISFDLGQAKTIDQVRIFWEEAFATAYEIQVSDDGQSWATAARLENQDGGLDEVSFAPRQASYLRMMALERKFREWGTSIWELEIYGRAGTNPGDRPYEQVFGPRSTPTSIALEPPLAGAGAWNGARHAGVNYTAWSELGYLSPESDETLAYLAAQGVNAIALVPTWYQDDLGAEEIAPWSGAGGRTPADAALAHAINTAHRLGMRVMLKPHLDLRTTASRVSIADPGAGWFASYSNFIAHYARLAETYDVELFCVGTELDATIAGHEQEWGEVIREVRGVYSGPLTYAANFPGYAAVPFWPELDFVGVDAYWQITGKIEPSDEELLAGWRSIADALEQWRATSGLDKPVIFTELGYPSVAGSNMQFGAPPSTTPAPEQQAAALRAALAVMSERPWFMGAYYWNYLPEARVADPTGFTIRGKPAEQVLFDAYRSWKK